MESTYPLHIDEPRGSRFELALEQFEKGEFFVFRGVGLGLKETELEIRAPIQWSPEYVDRDRAEAVIAEARSMIQGLKEASDKFKSMVAGLPVRIVVLYDYGMGALEIAESINGEFIWHDGYPKTDGAV